MAYEYRKLTPEERTKVVQERLARHYPPHSPPHPVRDRPYYLLSAACYNHVRHMCAQPRRQQTLNALFEWFASFGMEIAAWAVVPNHYHLLVHVTNFSALKTIFRRVHGSLSRQWNLEDSTLGRQVWCSYSDRAIRSEAHYFTTLNYLHYNPVKHRWTNSPYAWDESSVHWYLEHFGREWLRDLWTRYPIREYGRDWDGDGGSTFVGS